MELKQTKKDRKISRKDKKQWAVVDDLKHAVWLLKIEIEDKDRKHKSLIKMASKNLAQLAKQAGRITELEAERKAMRNRDLYQSKNAVVDGNKGK